MLTICKFEETASQVFSILPVKFHQNKKKLKRFSTIIISKWKNIKTSEHLYSDT